MRHFYRRFVVQALEPGAIAVCRQTMNESIAFIVAGELPVAATRHGLSRFGGLGEVAIEAFHPAIGLRMPWANKAVLNATLAAHHIERVPALGWLVFLALLGSIWVLAVMLHFHLSVSGPRWLSGSLYGGGIFFHQ